MNLNFKKALVDVVENASDSEINSLMRNWLIERVNMLLAETEDEEIDVAIKIALKRFIASIEMEDIIKLAFDDWKYEVQSWLHEAISDHVGKRLNKKRGTLFE
jgi:hypothetical protein